MYIFVLFFFPRSFALLSSILQIFHKFSFYIIMSVLFVMLPVVTIRWTMFAESCAWSFIDLQYSVALKMQSLYFLNIRLNLDCIAQLFGFCGCGWFIFKQFILDWIRNNNRFLKLNLLYVKKLLPSPGYTQLLSIKLDLDLVVSASQLIKLIPVGSLLLALFHYESSIFIVCLIKW